MGRYSVGRPITKPLIRKKHTKTRNRKVETTIYMGYTISHTKTDTVFAANGKPAKPIQPVQYIGAPLYYI